MLLVYHIHPLFLNVFKYLKDNSCSFALVFVFAIISSKSFAQSSTISLTANSNGTTCGAANGSIIVTASGGTAPYNYSLNNDPFQNSETFLYLKAGIYTIKVTDAEGEIASENVTLTNTFNPPTGVTSQYTLPTSCNAQDATLTLTGTGGTPPYQYSIDHTNFQPGNAFVNLNPGSYYTAVQDANGCMSPFIWYNQTLIPENCQLRQAGQTLSYICGPFRSWVGFVNMSGGTPPYVYSLDGINFQENNEFFPLGAGLYTITVKDAVGLKMLYSLAVHDACAPVLTLQGTVTPAQCGINGSITVLPVNGTSPYLYSIDGLSFQSTNKFSDLMPGTYTVYIKDGSDLVSSTSFSVGDNCLSLSTTFESSTCGNNNGSIKVEASEGTPPYQYSLDGINFTISNSFSNLSAGTYIITVKDAKDFINKVQVIIDDIAGPVMSSLDVTATGCDEDNGTIAVSGSGVSPLKYSINGEIFQDGPLFTGLSDGAYEVTVVDVNGCRTTKTVTIPVINTIAIDVEDDLTICEGETVKLNVSSNGNSFEWFPATGLNNNAILQPEASPKNTVTYKVTASTGSCKATGTVTVFVSPAPIADAGNDTTICLGKDFQFSGSGGVEYVWSPSTYLNSSTVANPIVTGPSEGTHTYFLEVLDNYGCKSLSTDPVKLHVVSVQVKAGNDTTIQANRSFMLHASDFNNSGFNDYTWSPATGLNNANIANPEVTIDRDMLYKVTAKTQDGCIATDEIEIRILRGVEIYVASAFTPNNDGRNDLLKAIPIGIKDFRRFSIYNRWGQLVFHTVNPEKGWDGKLNGQLQNDVFVWLAEGIDYNGNVIIRKGTVMLIR